MRAISHRSGFAMITAICLMSLVVMAAVAMNSAVLFEARRSRMLSEDAQLRQLLLAGSQIARTRLASSALPEGKTSIQLPQSLQQEGAGLSVESHFSSGDAAVEIEATMPGRRMSQQVHLKQSEGAWKIISANLGG